MNTQVNTNLAIQAVNAKTQPVKREESKSETSFSAQLKKCIDGAKGSEKVEKRSGSETKADVKKSAQQEEKPIQEETENVEQKTEAATQILSLFTAMMAVPIPEVPTQVDTGQTAQQAFTDVLTAAPTLMDALTVQQSAPQQPAETLPTLNQPTEQGAELPSFQTSLTEATDTAMQTQVVAPTTDTQPHESGENLLQSKQDGANASNRPAAIEAKAPEQKQAEEVKTQPDIGQLSAFAKRLDEAGLTFQKVTANEHVETPQANQVATAVLDAYKNGKTEFTMKLEPEMLGELTVKLVFEQGKLTLNILTSNDQATKVINAQMEQLRVALKESNIQMETCTVENQSFNNLAFDGEFSMQNGRHQHRPERSGRFVINRLPDIADNTLSPMSVLQATSILNCYV